MGMDCEMGETTEDENAVIGVGVVDDEGETVLDELIRPPGTLVDVRTEITGFKIEDFDGACTRDRA
jgi:RNA exonuclease 1